MKKTIKKAKKTIVICSSASFYKQVVEIRDILKSMGFKVLVPLTAGKMEKAGNFSVDAVKTWFNDPSTYDRKTFLTKHHFNKVAKSDAVLVLNYEKRGVTGYIGGAVLMEMGIGLHFKKKIYILNPVDSKLGYIEEILGMQPIFLNGDLTKIKK